MAFWKVQEAVEELVLGMQPHKSEVRGNPLLPVSLGLAACVPLLGSMLPSLCSLDYEAGYFIARDEGSVTFAGPSPA